MPLGPWPKDPRLKEIGAFVAIGDVEGIEAFTNVPFKEMLGWGEEEVIVFNAKFRAEVKRKMFMLCMTKLASHEPQRNRNKLAYISVTFFPPDSSIAVCDQELTLYESPNQSKEEATDDINLNIRHQFKEYNGKSSPLVGRRRYASIVVPHSVPDKVPSRRVSTLDTNATPYLRYIDVPV
ncbi:hypothetical protein VTN00DRAFT_7315 [Thermoascus crustaceus]|uniref:uncharacterized protein n=1 Tax=Thermoascus crustaceus TaxID=5088 RepID=UPI003742AB9D